MFYKHVYIDPVFILSLISPYPSMRLAQPFEGDSYGQTSLSFRPAETVCMIRVVYVRVLQFTMLHTIWGLSVILFIKLSLPTSKMISVSSSLASHLFLWLVSDRNQGSSHHLLMYSSATNSNEGWAVEVCERILFFQACLRCADGHVLPHVFLC